MRDKTQAIDTIKAKLDGLTTEQLAALADIADSFARDVPDEDDETRAAIAEGLAQANTRRLSVDASAQLQYGASLFK